MLAAMRRASSRVRSFAPSGESSHGLRLIGVLAELLMEPFQILI
jgi:hypothetical protein